MASRYATPALSKQASGALSIQEQTPAAWCNISARFRPPCPPCFHQAPELTLSDISDCRQTKASFLLAGG